MESLTLALDWTPNINHIGFFVAQAQGWYRALGLELHIVDPAADNYALTPAKKVERGEAHFALCPTESLISYQTKAQPFPLVAVAAVFTRDMSAIAVQDHPDLRSPRDLDGKRYASYRARYEDGIVRQMIRNDGGKGELEILDPDKLGIWNTILSGQADATWVFLNWEGVAAEAEDKELRYFTLEDYGIPYSYSPVIAVDRTQIEARRQAYASFLSATRRGFLLAQEDPAAAVACLAPFVPVSDQAVDLDRALARSAPHFGDASHWGQIEGAEVGRFLQWIYDHGLETVRLEATDLFTNELLAE